MKYETSTYVYDFSKFNRQDLSVKMFSMIRIQLLKLIKKYQFFKIVFLNFKVKLDQDQKQISRKKEILVKV